HCFGMVLTTDSLRFLLGGRNLPVTKPEWQRACAKAASDPFAELESMNRRKFVLAYGAFTGASLFPCRALAASEITTPAVGPTGPPPFKLGTVTYNIAANWDLETLLKVCKTTQFGFVELRTTHAHKVEPSLTSDQRKRVKQQFEEAGINLW